MKKSLNHNLTPVAIACLLLSPLSGHAASWSSGEGSGGDFEIEDTTNGTTPLTIKADAPSDSLFLDELGNLGLGGVPRRDPVGDFSPRFYISDPTPDIEFDDIDDSQIWQLFADGGDVSDGGTDDLGGIGFFDQTARNIPFYIESEAPTASMWVNTTGYVGLGTPLPEGKVHLFGDGPEEDAQVLVENLNTGEPGIVRRLFIIKNDGPAKFSMFASESDEWAFNARTDVFRISKQGTGRVEMELDDVGNLAITGTLSTSSSREVKHDIVRVDPIDVLAKVMEVPVATWSYNSDEDGIKHLGPMAEDFYSAFGLGGSNKTITPTDTSGVALAAVQGVKRDNDAKFEVLKTENAVLKKELQEQDERILQLEMALAELMKKESPNMRLGALGR